MSHRFVSVLAVASLAAALLGLQPEAQAQNRPAPCAPVTASGTITKSSGAPASFAAVAGCRNGRFWGSVSFTDLETNYEVTSTQITGYLWDPSFPNVREICGRALTGKREEVQFRLRIVDAGGGNGGGAGASPDEFGFATDNQHTAGSRFYVLKAAPIEAGKVRIQQTHRTESDRILAKVREFMMCGDLNSPK